MVKLVFLVLILCVSISPASTEDDFMDIGVQLKGNSRDFLVADLIAEENDFFNAGHVSDQDGLGRVVMGFCQLDSRRGIVSFPCSCQTRTTIETSPRPKTRRIETRRSSKESTMSVLVLFYADL